MIWFPSPLTITNEIKMADSDKLQTDDELLR
jgi:hypothetical protein